MLSTNEYPGEHVVRVPAMRSQMGPQNCWRAQEVRGLPDAILEHPAGHETQGPPVKAQGQEVSRVEP